MKKLIVMSALFLVAASTQAQDIIYWEGNDSWNGNIGSTDYVDGNAWSLDPLFGPYGFAGPQDGAIALIGNWGQAGTAATQPILDSAATGVPEILRLGGGGTLGTLDIIDGGSVTVAQLEVSPSSTLAVDGDGILTITNGASMTVTNGLFLGTGTSLGTINLTGGSFSLNAFTVVGDNGIINLSTNATFTLPGDMTGRGYPTYCVASDALSVRESYDSGADLTTIYASMEAAQAPGPEWTEPVAASDAVVGQNYSDTLVGKAIDPHGDPITFVKESGPDWLIVGLGGALFGSPLSSDLGTNTFTVSATDGTGFPAETTLTIVVGANPDGLQISINFNYDGLHPFAEVGSTIGPLKTASTNWNSSHALGGPYNSGELASGLRDSSGGVTGAGISYSASAVNYVGGQTGPDWDRLNRGFLDDDVSGLSITVSNIPYASYTVYGLVGGDPTGSNSEDSLEWQEPMKSLDFQVNGSWVYGDTSAGPAADVYTTMHGSRYGQTVGIGAEWVEIVQGSVTGMYWTTEASGSTLTIQGQAGTDTLTRGALSGIIIKEHIPAGPVQDLVINSSVGGVVLTWTGEAGMPYGVDTNINLVIPDWGRWETGLINPAGGAISVTNAVDADETFFRVISE